MFASAIFTSALTLSGLPMGDDTPIGLYVVIAVVAVILGGAAVVLGNKSKKK